MEFKVCPECKTKMKRELLERNPSGPEQIDIPGDWYWVCPNMMCEHMELIY